MENRKAALRAALKSDVERFVANGGKIETVTHTANQSFKAAHKGKQHIPMTVAPERFPRDHHWRASADGKKPNG